MSGHKDSKLKHTKLELHSISECHLNSIAKWSAFKSTQKTGSIQNQINSGHKQQVLENRDYIKQLIGIALYLSKQGISFRGHREDIQSLNRGTYININNLIIIVVFTSIKVIILLISVKILRKF